MVTDEALIAETAVWPNVFLMKVFFAPKGSKLFINIWYINHEPSSLFHHSILVDLSLSMMMH